MPFDRYPRKSTTYSFFYRCRCGWTLVELLVAIGIVGILIGLLLVVIQASRETTRRLECQNNLKQIGIAFTLFEDTKKYFPYSYPAPLRQIAPFMEMETSAESDKELNWHPIWLCPTDSGVQLGYQDAHTKQVHSRINYHGNLGTSPFHAGGSNGIFAFHTHQAKAAKKVRPKQVTDGLSNTVAFSEALRGGDISERDWLRTLWNVKGQENNVYFPEDYYKLIEICRNIPANAADQDWVGSQVRGSEWHAPSIGGVGFTLYNHLLPPNSPSCVNGGLFGSAIVSASSQHRGNGVNSVFGDGHVQYVQGPVEPSTWSALGTRSGKEVISALN